MLSRWQSTIVDAQGNVQPLANLTVRNEADQSLAKMWASPGTTQPLPDGMVQADGNGYAFFYARGGLYRITSVALGIDWREVQIGAALVNIGDYGPGLEITERNQIFWRDGELYRSGAVLELPYTTTGDWGAEEGLFVAVGDAALRQELKQPILDGKGALLVSGTPLYIQNISQLDELDKNSLQEGQIISAKGTNFYYSGGEFVLSGPVSIASFGAVPNNENFDNYQAIRDAITFALENRIDRMSVPSVKIPNGVWTIKKSGVFSGFPYRGQFITGLNIFGDGFGTSTLRLEEDPNVDETWFYQTGSEENQYIHDLKFENLGLMSSDYLTANVSGFSQYGTGEVKRFKFKDCRVWLKTFLRMDGTGNTDLNSIINSYLRVSDAVLVLNNNQSVVHDFINTSVETRGGDVVRVEGEGGGDVSFYGSAIEIYPTEGQPSKYAVKLEGDARMGVGNCNFSFNDVRFELDQSGDGGGLVYTPEDFHGPLSVLFNNCDLGTIRGTRRNIIDINSTNTKVTISKGTLGALYGFGARVYSPTGTVPGTGSPAHLIIEDVLVNGNPRPWLGLSSLIEVVGDFSRATLRRNTSSIQDSINTPMSHDIDIGYPDKAHNSPVANVTRKAIRFPGAPWPNNTTSNQFFLPEGIHVLKIHIKRQSFSAETTPYQLFVGKADKSVIVGESQIGTFNDEHIIDVQDWGKTSWGEWAIWAETDSTRIVGDSENILDYIEYI